MGIQWYPGHMTKARRLLAESMPSQDVIIEVLDARMPAASANPVLTELRRMKPCLKILNKSDLADPEITKAWLRFYETSVTSAKVMALALSTTQLHEIKTRIPAACKLLTPRGPLKPVRAMIVGIPNVGKSTLINTLMDRKVAKVGDEPAVTKAQQRVTLKNGISLWDNPGILWPKIDDEEASYRLALGGAIPDTVIDYESVGHFAARYFLRKYPALIKARYKLTELPGENDLLAEIGRRRGCLRSGGAVDLHKAADILVHEFRTGAIGRISLEEPPS